MAELGVAWISVVPDTSPIAPGIRKAFGEASRGGKRSGGMLGGAFATAAKRTIAGAGIATAAASALTIKGGWNRLLQIDDARARLKGLGLSIEDIGQVQSNVDKAVTGTAFSLAEGMTAATTAMSSGVKQGKELERYLTLIGDVATQGGAEYGEMASIINQVQARGKVGQENLNRLTERGIGIQAMLADHFGVTGDELAGMLRKGQISAAEFQMVLEKNFAGSAQKAGDTVRGSFANMRTAFSRLGASMLEPIFEKMPGVFMGIRDTINQAQPAAAAFGQAVGDIASKYGPPLIDGLMGAGRAIGNVVSVAWRLRGVIAAAAAGYIAYRGALVAATVATRAKTVATTALWMWQKRAALSSIYMTMATKGLTAAMRANPIGAVVTALTALAAGAVWAFKNVGWFRDGVLGAWSWIKSATATAWSFLKGVFSALADWVGGWLPQAFGFLKTIVGAYLQAIGTYFKVWWSVAKLVFQLAVAFVRFVLAPTFQWLWSSIIKPVFGFILGYLRFWWSGLKAVFGAVRWYISTILAPIFSWLWRTIISPIFKWIGGHISSVWNGVVKPVFSTFRDGVAKVGEAFGKARDAISRAWSRLGDIIRGPIDKARSVINGFLEAIDSIPGVTLAFRIGKVAAETGSDRAMASRGPILRRATGGPIFGPGSGTSDSILARLSNNEHVLTAKEVAMAGGHRAIEGWRAAIRSGKGIMHGLPGFATGGRVISAGLSNKHSRAQYPWATFAGDFAAPMGTPVHAWKAGTIALVRSLTTSYGKHIRMNHEDGTSSLYAHLSRFNVGQGDRVRQGAKIGEVGSTGNSTGPHLHLELLGGLYRAIKGLMDGASSVWDTLKGATGRVNEWIGDKLTKKGKVGGLLGNMSGLFGNVGGQVRDWVKGKLFDNGGWMMPGDIGFNRSSRPEPVFTGRQWEILSSAIHPGSPSKARPARPGGQLSGRITITNWEQGTGYFESIASEEAALAVTEYDGLRGQLGRMGSERW